ncbi:DUF3019 domain-containing protein [Rheinheimera riviphila]|uniref:DUF3019 domain-containing protein n=1 Tax=Rheinheimera riviphila TaxID=1834037 RepID=A0A437R501_9GAMM|nr:DUF3019 domain-containing protein [Rheinheimera riviphila]RVU41803.1 DUF3019 domain-containing protein [Rheinheimera riviphila]
MCFSRQCCWILLISALLLHCTGVGATEAVAVVLKMTPDTCVSLQQGRTCYSKVTARWHSNQPLDLCLAIDDQVLQCWKQQQQGQHQFEFAAASTSVVRLLQDQQPLAQAQIEVNWVHKASRAKRHWRLF